MTTSAPENIYAQEVQYTIEANSDSLREISLKIHGNPELGYEEIFAHHILTDYLEEQGFKVTRGACDIKTAFIAEYESPATVAAATAGERVHAIGFCSEYDALPEVGHACGHNLIAIEGVAAAMGVKAALEKNNLVGRVRLVGTPAEETTGGKILMIERGAFNGLDACLMSHPACADIVYNTILSAVSLKVEYFGKASHASGSPWEGVNALDAMVMAYQGLGLLRQQTMPTSRLHCIITNGGQAVNIIPSYAAGEVMYRSPNTIDHARLRDDVLRILNGVAETTGCTVKITKEMENKSVPHNELLAGRYASYHGNLGVRYLPRSIQESAPGGSTDMGDVAHFLPGIHPCYNIVSLEGKIDISYSNHSLKFTDQAKTVVAHEATLRSAKGLALTGLDVLTEPGFAEAVKEDFEKRVPHHGGGSLADVKKLVASASAFSATGGCGCC